MTERERGPYRICTPLGVLISHLINGCILTGINFINSSSTPINWIHHTKIKLLVLVLS